jgi:hypothetical protein
VRLTTGAALLGAVFSSATGWSAPAKSGLPLKELAGERYALVTDPDKLPIQLREALAREVKQPKLHMAAAGSPYISGDVVMDKSLPIHRLILAAVGEKHAIVHFESGGYAASRRVVVFELTEDGVATLWSEMVRRRISAPVEFEQAIKDGSLFETTGGARRE